MSFHFKKVSYLVNHGVPGAGEAATFRSRGDRQRQPVVFVICSPVPQRQELSDEPDFLFRSPELRTAFGHKALSRG
jgi:hypothetical protein